MIAAEELTAVEERRERRAALRAADMLKQIAQLREQVETTQGTLNECRDLAESATAANCRTIHRMRSEIAVARSLILRGIEIMTDEQVGRWAGVRTWLEGVDSDIQEAALVAND